MKDIVKVVIDAPVGLVAGLFANPEASDEWMEDLRYEALSGVPGTPGSTYRLASRRGKMNFTATVIERALPHQFVVTLDDPSVSVVVKGSFRALSANRTELTSEETFAFRGPIRKIMGTIARPAIHKVHRRQMMSFKAFAERSSDTG